MPIFWLNMSDFGIIMPDFRTIISIFWLMSDFRVIMFGFS